MPATAAATWLNDFFSGYDHAILSLMHSLASGLGGVLTPLTSLITLLGEHGLVFYLLAVICALFADRRDTGVCIFGAVCCGALITNIILKDSVCRPRPFESSDEFYAWWQFVGAPAEDGFSFPSGHVTACAAGMTALCNMKGRKLVLPSVIIVLLMAISRNYLMVHYPSDVLVAAIIGVFSGFVAWFITQFIFHFLRRHRNVPIFELMLDFDLREILPFELPTGEGIGAFIKSLFGHIGNSVSRSTRGRSGKNAAEDEDELFIDDEDADMKTYTGSDVSPLSEPDEAEPEIQPARRASSIRRSMPKISVSTPAGRHEKRPAEPEEDPVPEEPAPRRSFSVTDLNDVASEKPVISHRRPEPKAAPAKRPAAPKLKVPGGYKGKHEL